jgi:hypothetical protein
MHFAEAIATRTEVKHKSYWSVSANPMKGSHFDWMMEVGYLELVRDMVVVVPDCHQRWKGTRSNRVSSGNLRFLSSRSACDCRDDKARLVPMSLAGRGRVGIAEGRRRHGSAPMSAHVSHP